MNIHKEPDMKTYIVEPDHGYALYLMKKNHEIFIIVMKVLTKCLNSKSFLLLTTPNRAWIHSRLHGLKKWNMIAPLHQSFFKNSTGFIGEKV